MTNAQKIVWQVSDLHKFYWKIKMTNSNRELRLKEIEAIKKNLTQNELRYKARQTFKN